MQRKKKKNIISNPFNCSDLSDFVNSIIQVMPFKGSSMSRFYICEVEGVIFLTKLCFYRKTSPEIYGKPTKNVMSHADAEINILQVLKDKFIDTNVTHCIIESLYVKICVGTGDIVPRKGICNKLLTTMSARTAEEDVWQLMCKNNDLIKNNLAYDKCAFIVLDKCDISFEKYLLENINSPISIAIFKSLLFQIIYTMYAINKIYPKFRHYDLHTENIMLKIDTTYKFQAGDQKYLLFHVEKKTFAIPYFGIIPKIIDFGFSILPEKGIISNIIEDRIQMYFRAQNDLLFLFHYIYLAVSYNENKWENINKILSKLEPNQLYIQYYTEYIRKNEDKIPTYYQMLKNNVWDEYMNNSLQKSQIYNDFTPVELIEK